MKVVIAQNVSLENHLALSTYLRNISVFLARREEIDLSLVVQEPPAALEGLSPQRIKTVRAHTYTLGGNLEYTLKLLRLLREEDREAGIDVIHCLYPNSSLQAAVLFKRMFSPKVKIIYDIRSPWIEVSMDRLDLNRGRSLYRKAAYAGETLLGRFVDGFVFITAGLREFYSRALGRDLEPSWLVPSGVDPGLFRAHERGEMREKLRIPAQAKVLGYVGVLSRERELDFAIRAVRLLSEKGVDCRLVFVGDGEDRERLEGVASRLGLRDRVMFTGQVIHDAVPRYIAAFDFGLCHLPDTLFFRRSFPMKVLEYAACGVQVMASDIKAHLDIARELPLLLYRHDDPGDLARLLEETERRPACVPDGLARYSWERIAADLALCYSEVLRPERAALKGENTGRRGSPGC